MTSSSLASSLRPRSCAIFLMISMLFCPPSNVCELTIGDIPSIAGVLVKANECKPVAFPSFFRTVMTGERYRYSLFSRY